MVFFFFFLPSDSAFGLRPPQCRELACALLQQDISNSGLFCQLKAEGPEG